MTDIISWGLRQNLKFGTKAPYGRNAIAEYMIEVSDGDSLGGLNVITSDARYPLRMSPLLNDPTMLCIDTALEQNIICPNAWMLRVEWDNVSPQPFPTFFDNPLRREAVIESTSYETMKRLEQDEDGDPVVTTAGEVIFLEIPVDYRMFTITKNVTALPDAFAERGNFTNKDVVTILGHPFKANILQLKKVDLIGPKWENGFKFYESIWTILSNPEGWLFKRRNTGFQEKGPKKTVVMPDGTQKVVEPLQSIIIGPPGKRQYPSSAVLLDPDGHAYKGKDLNTNEDCVLTPETNSTGGITAKQWADSLLKFRGYTPIVFNGNVPLK